MFKLGDARKKHARRAFAPLAAVVMVMLAATTVFAAPTVAKANPFADAWNGIVSFFARGSRAVTEGTTVDGSTLTDWQQHLTTDGKTTTQNVGRIWTDKTVANDDITLTHTDGEEPKTIAKGSSDFLIGLSALSSTSNLATTTSKPLDISLVLDVSGSMDNGLVPYTKVFDLEASGDEDKYDEYSGSRSPYYILINGEWKRIQWKQKDRQSKTYGWRTSNRINGDYVWVTPETNEGNATPGATQVYRQGKSTSSKLVALKKAVNQFIDETAKQNESIEDESMRHKISIVKFAGDKKSEVGNDKYWVGSDHRNYTQIVKKLTSDTASLKDAVGSSDENGLTEGGATSADYGFEKAAESLFNANGGRDNAQKVVIFFTDGEPNHSSGWNEDVANAAIQKAKELKDKGTLVYSIGVVDGADPSNTTSRLNKYLHGVSSNYKEAQSIDNLGVRTQKDGEDANYYFAANSSDELSAIFSQIQQDIHQDSVGSPTETNTTEGAQDTSGYITFTDQLGDYMEVDDFKNIVYADTVYEKTGETTNGNVVTYVFNHNVTGNAVYPITGNLDNILITVNRAGDGYLKTGDKVEVKIPASLIPLRNFKVDKAADGSMKMSVDEAYPIRVFYGVSLKDKAAEQIANGTFADTEYINAHKSADGTKVYFNSNAYSGNKSADKKITIGDTTAVYEPASNNSFYYFTANTPVYKDDAFVHPVKRDETLDENANYYYKQAYIERQDDGTAKEHSVTVGFKGSSFEVEQGHWDYDQNDELYIKAGTPRLTRTFDFNSKKYDNDTQTAESYVNTDWGSYVAPKYMQAFLGNNGRIEKELPGTLAVSKTVNVGVGLNDYSNKDFTFNIKVNGMAKGSKLKAAIKTGDTLGDVFELTFGEDNTATRQLKGGQTLYVYGIPAGTHYEVTEDSAGNGWSTTKQGDSGTVSANQTSTAAFTNAYSVTPVKLAGNEYLKIQKDLQGRSWQSNETFKFVLSAKPETPMPTDAKLNSTTGNLESYVDVANENVTNFGDIQYETSGNYEYEIFERTPVDADRVKGTAYSPEHYIVTVAVTDNGNGGLTVESVMKRTVNVDNEPVDTSISDNIAKITNTFSTYDAPGDILIQKTLTNNSDSSHNLKVGDFTFKLKAKMNGAPMPTGTPDADGYVTTTNAVGGSAVFRINFNAANHDGHTYEYELREDIPDGANAQNNYTLNGMKYDPTVYTVKISVSVNAGTGALDVEVKYYDVDGTTLVKDQSGKDISRAPFNNVYTPTELVLTGNTAIKGSKKLVGRDALSGEEFTFTLAAQNIAAKEGLKDDTIVFGNDTATETLTQKVADAKNGAVNDFSFDNVTFKRPGTYTFTVTESTDGKKNGLAYDEHVALVTVKVDDVNSALTPAVTYNNNVDKAPESVKSEINKAAFENVYASSLNYNTVGGLQVTKKLTGRAMANAEFRFTITGVQGTNTTEDDANAKLAEADKAFGNAPKSAGILDVMNKLQDVRFTQDDAGKTYVYLVDEKLPVDENGIERADDDSTLDGFQYQGVTYDQSEYRVEIAVTDNGESVLTATTTITKVKDKDGKAASEQIGSYTEKNKLVSIPFENAYSAKSVTVDTSADVALKKVLAGRTWAQGDEFGFTISNKTKPSNVATAPMPNGSTVTVDQTDALNNEASFNFGTLTFDTVGTYVYEVRETVPENATNPKVNDGQTQYKDAGDKWGETGWTLNGITYDNHVATITIKIADPGNGQLNKDVSVAGATFTNRYSAATGTDGSAVFKASKMLEGRNMVDDEFDFSVNLRKADGSGIGKEVFAGSNTKADNGVASGISFDSGVFTYTTDSLKELVSEGYATPGADGKSWTVYYVVAEETGEGALPEGVTPKDNVSSYNFTVTVTDDGDGKLTAMLGTDAQNIEFKNQYAATHPATYAITVEKQLTNRNMKAGEFDFYLKGVASENKLVDVASGTNAAGIEVAGANSTWSAPVNFGAASDGKYAFSFTQAMLEQAEEDGYAHAERTGIETTWTVNYKLYEDATAGNLPGGVTPVTSSFDLTFKVKDDGAGKLEVTSFTRADEPSAQDPSMTFTFKNAYDTTYDGSDVTANAKFTKVLDGRDWKDSDNFTFTIEGKDGAPLPVDEKSNPVSEVTVNEATAKDFSFGTFKYTLDDVKNEPNREKEFIYTVSEKEPAKGAISGVAYDKHPATLKIKVKDDGSGKLVATATVENGTFTNVYTSTVDLSAKLPIELRKTLTNRGMTDGQFAFTVTPLAGENGSPTADEVKDKLGLKDDAYEAKATELGGTSVIDLLGKDVTFTNDDAGKTYAFEVNETFPATDADGYTKDPNEAVVTIKPTYAADSGILTVEVTVKKGDEAKTDFITSDDSAKQAIVIPFVNSYDASTDPDKGGAKATVAVKKTLTGRPMTAGEFAFNVTTKGRNGGETTVKQGVKNAADGTVDFGEFGYTIEELNKAFDEGWADRTVDPTSKNATWTLHYTASEVTDGLSNGVSPKHASFDFDIVVVDNGNGSLTATYKPGAEAYFENAYSTDNAAASIDLAGSKILTGRALNADEFSFTATPLDGAPALEKADAKNDASGNVNFGTINFTLDDLNKAPDGAEAETKAEDADKTAEETTDETTDEAQAREGAVRSHTFYYEVTEQNNGLPGITYDQAATKKVGITVTDDGQGHLTAKLADGATKAFTFTNSYDVTSTPSTPTGKGGLTVTKTLIGRDMTADDKFTFELVDEAGNVVSTGTSPVAKDGEAATIEMTPVTFTGRGSRTQNFTLREVKGDKGGVAYDGATYPVAANVVDNGDGTLSVTWSTTADKIAFTNSYSTADTTLGIVAAKMLAGRDLKDGEFSFKLQQVGTKDNKSWTAKNDANGQVTFPVLTFVDPGLYEFEISEVKGDEKNVSYDETIYKVNVAVTDDGNGHLTAQATYVDGDPVFKNTYTKPAEPAPTPEPTPEPEPAPTPEPEEPKAPELPKTGDDSMLPIAAAVVAGAVCIGGGLVLSRRRK